ncbi:hypothetical protein BpHYR1_023236 [Brachionus plicatilis]|uniref:Uncharacterized protein n=1 Tax=Brachionus plicatilis TaxID=10195 RepID=A0A3M7RDT3_BRAPC|nr:hypothetical protein BpHYR1_023236 [Brachionus plicatilis]
MALKRLKNEAASGPDQIHNFIVPKAWKTSNITLIQKKASSLQDALNYRPISIRSCLGKLLECIGKLENKINKYTNKLELWLIKWKMKISVENSCSLTSCLNYKPVFLIRTHGILVLSFINPPYLSVAAISKNVHNEFLFIANIHGILRKFASSGTCSHEVEQADWLEKITATKAPKKLLISLLTQTAVLVAKKKEQPDASHHSKSTSQSSLSTTMESTHQQQQIIEPDMSPMENRVFNRRPQFKMDDIPKLYGNDKDKIEEWIYLVETEAEDQGIDKNRLVTAVKGNQIGREL